MWEYSVRQFENLVGKQFGLLIALARIREGGRSKWVCSCRCGGQTKVRQADLVKGRTKSCGCVQLKLKQAKAEKKYSLVNQRFGKLLVLWKGKKRNGRSMVWDCRCDCGALVSVIGSNLRSGKTKSCGCLKRK